MALPPTAKTMTFIVTRDRIQAKVFYGETLGFPLTHEDDFAAVFDLNGVVLRVSTLQNHTPQAYTVLGWDVPDIVSAAQALREKGVPFVIYDGFGQDELGIWSVPGGTTKVAWFTDPDGNLLSLTQF
jgi:catechol 2,3-dioxygenase-like lactoylglutathione lyase family enzyme